MVMGYTSVWKILEEMLIELRQKELPIPPPIMDDLKSAKTVIRMLTDDDRAENIQKIEQYLLNVESYLVTEGQKRFGQDYVDKWLNRIDKASRETHDEEPKRTRFVPGVQRQQKWIRVAPSKELPVETLRNIAEKTGISCKVQEDGSLLAFGEEQNIKDFVKKMALKYKPKEEK